MFILPGWISDDKKIEDIYRKSIIYTLPSYNEGMPMSILEAMSYGLPVISTNVGSIPSVVEKENGFITKPGDIDELTNKIIFLLNNSEISKSMSERNVEKINLKYNVYNSLDHVYLLYKKLLRNKNYIK